MRRQLAKTSAGVIVALGLLAGCSIHQAATDQVTPARPPGYEAHNTADVAFVQQMIPLQERAIALSDALLTKPGVNPYVTDLATSIKSIDGPEITQMQGWLTGWGNPDGVVNGGGVAEMASDPSPADIEGADPSRAATLFLRQMITNRERALALSKAEIDAGEYRVTVAVARANQVTQQRQITTMKSLLGSP
ncbi:DUF305 domain-containing protein [Mycobacterium sp. CVI_P3]|uniref:DUF305 domain-containing protein n=1 Tax=Mycobacterium pinniadriaticum TaxID=2994102 RepID=A0ABT3SGP3_9MYCO|nr:DUF305 domain-containing protein [Mycobacterium pinniadriaticum]MCX2932214.1 DUF305 domain-containing protein [Mycobacterium pinniadriaticum]MCX2938686.1 DUF305 domain-containing protein [Mycobacterium pinniadriaticum]